MRYQILGTVIALALAPLLINSCASIPAKKSPSESLVVIKTEFINPNNLPIGREYYVNYSGDIPRSRMGDNAGKFITVVIPDDNSTTVSITTETRGSFEGKAATYLFMRPLPYQAGSITIADFVLIYKTWRTTENSLAAAIDLRKISDEEKEALMDEMRKDSSFAAWFPPAQ